MLWAHELFVDDIAAIKVNLYGDYLKAEEHLRNNFDVLGYVDENLAENNHHDARLTSV